MAAVGTDIVVTVEHVNIQDTYAVLLARGTCARFSPHDILGVASGRRIQEDGVMSRVTITIHMLLNQPTVLIVQDKSNARNVACGTIVGDSLL